VPHLSGGVGFSPHERTVQDHPAPDARPDGNDDRVRGRTQNPEAGLGHGSAFTIMVHPYPEPCFALEQHGQRNSAPAWEHRRGIDHDSIGMINASSGADADPPQTAPARLHLRVPDEHRHRGDDLFPRPWSRDRLALEDLALKGDDGSPQVRPAQIDGDRNVRL
jgi:hypothetical protein